MFNRQTTYLAYADNGELAALKGILLGNIPIDCKDPEKQRDFYADLIGWDKCTLWDCPALVGENGLLAVLFMGCDFDYVPCKK